uniref:Uncharacterized protein n=1 Tax=Nostoc flagelliforme str. Sunitezuoqi TaxID=676037 RepID=E7DQG0_9NOSO|nr:hypothetical protein Nfla_9903 [Nostoc flagelliforme str. Sunitezuoqi]
MPSPCGVQQSLMGETPKTALLHRINNIFGTTDISRRFRPQGESDGSYAGLNDALTDIQGAQRYGNPNLRLLGVILCCVDNPSC